MIFTRTVSLGEKFIEISIVPLQILKAREPALFVLW